MFNHMCSAFQMWNNLICQNQVCFEWLIRFSKIYCIFAKISTPWIWRLYSFSAMFHGKRASSYETVARKFRPSGVWIAVFPPESHNKYGRCSTMACSRDFGGGYKSCSHRSNLWYPLKDSTRYPRQIGPKERTCLRRRFRHGVMVLSRNCKQPLVEIQGKYDHWVEFGRDPRHSAPHRDNYPLQDQPCSCTMDQCTPLTKYQGPAAARSRGRVGLAKQKFWFECDRKRACFIKRESIPTLSSVIYALRFTWCEWYPSSINLPLNT